MLLRTFIVTIIVGGTVIFSLGQNRAASLISAPPFEMPEAARAAGIDGRFLISLSIDKKGIVKDVKFLAGPSWPCNSDPDTEITDLRKAIENNLRQAKFEPRIQNGKPTSVEVEFNFLIGEAYKAHVQQQEDAKKGTEPPRIWGEVLNGRALSLPRPAFPLGARRNTFYMSGYVSVEVVIGEDGKVLRAAAMSGDKAFHEASRDAACKAKFSPTTVSGRPVEVRGTINYSFQP
jgi:outer membrane biosynthesis protein TonB